MKWIIIILIFISCTNNDEDMIMYIQGLSSESGGVTPPVFPANGVRVLLLTGQSNALGAGLNSEAISSEIDATSDLMIWNGSVFVNLDIGSGNNLSSVGKHGRELGLSVNYTNDFDTPLYLIKLGSSGTPITDHLSGGVEYEAFWIDVKDGINNLINAGYRPFVYMAFHQGEADGAAALAPLYADKLDTWASLWRTNLGANLPITVTEIKESLPDSHTINEAFDAKELTENYFKVIQAKDLASYDGVHLTYASQKNVAAQNQAYLVSMTPIEITTLIP